MKWESLKTRGPDGDPILDLADVCDLNEILLVRAVNEERASKRAEQQAKSKTPARPSRRRR